MSTLRSPIKLGKSGKSVSSNTIINTGEPEMDISDISSDYPTSKDMMAVLVNIECKVSTTETTLSNFIAKTSNDIERVDRDVASQKKEIDSNTSDIGSLRAKFTNFETKSDSLSYSLELNKQHNIRNNITITGVPYTAAEDLLQLAIAVFKFIGANVTTADINSTYRFKYGSRFVVKFANFDMKATVMKLKDNKTIPLSAVTGVNEHKEKPIYINTHLIPFFGHILSQGRRAVQQKLLHSCWMSGNGVIAKLKADADETIIHSVSELVQLCGKPIINPVTNTNQSHGANKSDKRKAKQLETSPINRRHRFKKPNENTA